MLKFFFALLFLFRLNAANAQIIWDTARDLSRHEAGYGTFKPSLKASMIYNGNVGFEIGRVREHLSLVAFVSSTFSKYYGVSWVANKNYKSGLYSFKLNYDINFRYLYIGLGTQMQTDFNKPKFYLIPSVGLYHLGTIGIYYARLVRVNKIDFIGNNNHQFGLSYNFTKDLAKEFKKGVGY